MPSTSRPASVSRSASCLVGRFRSTYSFNHERGINIVYFSKFRAIVSYLIFSASLTRRRWRREGSDVFGDTPNPGRGLRPLHPQYEVLDSFEESSVVCEEVADVIDAVLL
jgi:hypothetical protein